MGSKRGASSELNHDNWNDEEEVEERGMFKQADQNALKERVFRKARRRNPQPGGEATGGTFAAFGGFKTTSAGAASAKESNNGNPAPTFDFLKNVAAPLTTGNGATNDDNKSSGFSFANPVKSSASAFSFGNGAAKDSSAPSAGFSLGNGSSSAVKSPGESSGFSFGNNGTANTNGSSGLFSFGKKTEKEDKNGTEEEKKSEDKKVAEIEPAANKFVMPKSNKWTCDMCMVPNDPSVLKCVCCETPKPGAKIEEVKKDDKPVNSGFSMAPGGGFKFDTSKSNSDVSSSGFKFGSSASTTTTSSSAAPAPTGFKFGSSESVSTVATPEKSSSSTHNKYVHHLKALNRQVSKWIKSHVDSNPNVILSPIFKDYEKHLKEITEKYPPNTNSTASSSSPEKKPPVEESKPLLGAFFGKGNSNHTEKITFGSSDKKSTEFSSFSSTSTSNNEKPSEKPASTGFSFGGGGEKSKTESNTTSATGDFTFGKKTEGFTFGSSSSTTESSTKSSGFTFGSSNVSAPSSTFTFGAAAADKPSAPATSGFTFGSSSAFGSSSTGGSSFFAGAAAAAAAANEKSDNAAAEDDEDEPPKVEVKTVEEEGSLHSVRCKLYYKKEKDFVEKGLGMLHLKKIEGTKIQMVIRADTNLGNIFLNILLNDKISFTQRNNNVIFVTVPNPPIHGMPDGPATLLIKLKNAAIAEELNDKIKDLLSKAGD